MSLTDLMRDAMRPAGPANVTLDAVESDSGVADYVEQDIALKAASAVQVWLDTDDLDKGESYADRLMMMMVGIADANKDGELDEDEQGIVEVALNAAFEYMVGKGVSEEDAGSLLNDWDADVAERVRDLMQINMPDDDESSMSDIDSFAFGDADQEPALDAVYKKRIAFKAGRKVFLKKRISGTVRLSAKQKMGIRKMHMKSHSAKAQMHRKKSMRMRAKAGF